MICEGKKTNTGIILDIRIPQYTIQLSKMVTCETSQLRNGAVRIFLFCCLQLSLARTPGPATYPPFPRIVCEQ